MKKKLFEEPQEKHVTKASNQDNKSSPQEK